MKLSVFGFFLFLILTSCTGSFSPDKQPPAEEGVPVDSYQTVHSGELKRLLTQQEAVLLDVRTVGEYAAGHLKDAVHMDFYAPDFASRLQELDRSVPYVLYCASGGRSKQAAIMMKSMGFKKVYDATDGFQKLKNIGLPLAF